MVNPLVANSTVSTGDSILGVLLSPFTGITWSSVINVFLAVVIMGLVLTVYWAYKRQRRRSAPRQMPGYMTPGYMPRRRRF